MTILLALLMGVGGPADAAEEAEGHRFYLVREHIQQLVAGGKVPSMAVAVARHGRIIWEEGFGLADREAKTPATQHTRYPLASISKPLTATALMVLVEGGAIDLDRPVNDYLEGARLQAHVGDARQATVRRLASHTAGLPLHARHFYDAAHQPPPMADTIQCYGRLVSVPGERFQYANLGYGILGYVISRVSGRPYADVMRETVFAPLGMHRSGLFGSLQPSGDAAVKYTPSGAPVPAATSDSPAAGDLYGSAHDLIRFAMFHLKNHLPDQRAVISYAAIDEMQRPNPETGPLRKWERAGSGYGIGWRIGVMANGLRVVHHSGRMQGVSTELALVPAENIAVVVLSNTADRWPEAVLMEIGRTLLPGKLEDIPSPGGAPAPAAPFAPGPELLGVWQGLVHTCEGRMALALEITAAGRVYAQMGEQCRTALQGVCYQDDFVRFNNAGGGPFLRGWMPGTIPTQDVQRGAPCKLWLELKRRENRLCGSLIAFSQRNLPTGPLSHWVTLERR